MNILFPFSLLVLVGNLPLSVEGCKEITNIAVISGAVQLGRNATVFCSADKFDICNQYVKWTHGPNDTLITFDNGPIDPQKYRETRNHQGFGLTIINVTEQDLNIIYTCYCGFEKDSKILKMEEKNKTHNDAETYTYVSTYAAVAIGILLQFL